jgi:hypothetical protein
LAGDGFYEMKDEDEDVERMRYTALDLGVGLRMFQSRRRYQVEKL